MSLIFTDSVILAGRAYEADDELPKCDAAVRDDLLERGLVVEGKAKRKPTPELEAETPEPETGDEQKTEGEQTPAKKPAAKRAKK